MTGFWSGRFWYVDPSDPAVPFIMNLEDLEGALSGSTSEPDTITFSGGRLHAFVRGSRSGTQVSFAKVYDGAAGAAHRVDYSGALSEDGLAVSGEWALPGLSGGFVMTREALEDEEVEAEEQVEAGA